MAQQILTNSWAEVDAVTEDVQNSGLSGSGGVASFSGNVILAANLDLTGGIVTVEGAAGNTSVILKDAVGSPQFIWASTTGVNQWTMFTTMAGGETQGSLNIFNARSSIVAFAIDTNENITIPAGDLTVTAGGVTVGQIGSSTVEATLWQSNSGFLGVNAGAAGFRVLDDTGSTLQFLVNAAGDVSVDAGDFTVPLGQASIGRAILAGTTLVVEPDGTDRACILQNNIGASMLFTGTGDLTMASGENAADSAILVRKDSTSSRSINAAGTINASGADAAEYIHLKNASEKIAKGAIVGFDKDGLIVTQFSEARSFGVKSTNPHIVGGDTWGTAEKIGERPEEPYLAKPEYIGAKLPEVLAGDPTEAELEEYDAKLALYNIDYKNYQDEVQALQDEIDVVLMPQYLGGLKVWKEKLESARQAVDRIAFCGIVPVNDVMGDVGDFVIPVEDTDGAITGKAVALVDMTLADSLVRVGCIHSIGDDGRINIKVLMG